MVRNPQSSLNKEKLIFIGTATLLAASLYHSFAARPVELAAGIPVTPLPAPTPLPREKLDTRQSNALAYFPGERNPFQPVDAIRKPPTPPVPKPPTSVIGVTPVDNGWAPDQPRTTAVRPTPRTFPVSDATLNVDFSAVISMHNTTVALLKSNGQTLQVKAGDYLEDQKIKIAKIDPKAIYVTDANDREFIARDTTFDTDKKRTPAGTKP